MNSHLESETEGLELSGPPGFYVDPKDLLDRQLDIKVKPTDLSIDSSENNTSFSLEGRFSIDRISKNILDLGVKKVALQFPDELLNISDQIVQLFQVRCPNCDFFLLADTSYGSCCIDEVASSHASAEFLIHVGHCCLSLIDNFPIAYSFDCQPIDVPMCVDKISSLLEKNYSIEPACKQILIISELCYSYKLEQIQEELNKKLSNKGFEFIIGHVPHSQNVSSEFSESDLTVLKIVGADMADLESQRKKGHLNRLCGRYFSSSVLASNSDTFDDIKADIISKETAIVYIGSETIELSNLLITKDPNLKVYRCDVGKKEAFEDGQTVNRRLMRRYHLVQKARDASTFGIVVGTLGVGNYMEMIEHIKSSIENNGGKVYTFVMGKLNVAKLANFLEIEIFVLVACPENSLIDSKEFLRPVITPYELDLALNSASQWTGRYVTDFVDILKEANQPNDVCDKYDTKSDSDDDNVPHFSLVTGKFVNPRQFHRATQKIELEMSNEVLLRDQPGEISRAFGSSAGEYLSTRTFQGLDPKLDQSTPIELAEQGRKGIARGYMNEKDL